MLRADVVGLLPERRSEAARSAAAAAAAGRGRGGRRGRRPCRPPAARLHRLARRQALRRPVRGPARTVLPVAPRTDERRLGLPDRRRRGAVAGAPRVARRAAKPRRYEPLRPGLRVAGLPLNVAYYLPEGRDPRIAAVPAEDRALVEAVAAAQAAPGQEPSAVRVTREEIDARWADRPLPDSAYAARFEPGPLEPFAAGEVRALDVRVTNLRSEVWPHGRRRRRGLRLAYRGLPSALRTPLPHDVAPGESTLVPVVVEAPEEHGRHPFTLDV